jgi:hypothetical protein
MRNLVAVENDLYVFLFYFRFCNCVLSLSFSSFF